MGSLRAAHASAPLLCLVALVPVAAGGGIHDGARGVPTTLYFHVSGLDDFPINTQRPDDRYAKSADLGLATPSLSCFPDVGQPGLVRGTHHTFYGYSSPSYVEYDFDVGGEPLVHPERGLSFDAELDLAQGVVLHWYVETQAVPGEGAGQSVPLVLPAVVVEATLRTGDNISLGDEAYNAGAVLAEGRSGPVTLAMSATSGAEYVALADGRHLYHFTIPMDWPAGPVVPAASGFNARIDVHLDNPVCPDPGQGYLMPDNIRIHTSAEHRPRLELAVLNPIELVSIHPQFVGDDLVIHVEANSPWGSYDVADRPQDLALEIAGPTPARGLQLVAVHNHTHGHYNHFAPVMVVYAWPYTEDGARPGRYDVTVEVWNDHRTASATGTARFEVGDDGQAACAEGFQATPGEGGQATCGEERPAGRGSPGAPLPALLAGLAAALAAALRRGGGAAR